MWLSAATELIALAGGTGVQLSIKFHVERTKGNYLKFGRNMKQRGPAKLTVLCLTDVTVTCLLADLSCQSQKCKWMPTVTQHTTYIKMSLHSK